MSLRPVALAAVILLAAMAARPALAFSVGSHGDGPAMDQGSADQQPRPPAAYHYSNPQFNFSMSRSAAPDGTVIQRRAVSPGHSADRPGLFQRLYRSVFGD